MHSTYTVHVQYGACIVYFIWGLCNILKNACFTQQYFELSFFLFFLNFSLQFSNHIVFPITFTVLFDRVQVVLSSVYSPGRAQILGNNSGVPS